MKRTIASLIMGTVSQFQVINQLRLPLIILVTYAHSYNEVA